VAPQQKSLSITPVRKASVIQVDYALQDPHLAVSVLLQLSDSYLEAHLRPNSTPRTYQFFAGQTARYQQELNDAEAKLTAFRQQDDIARFPPLG
jgi:uncharacterized protein involved in exopolysaccharide biosynthesis